MTNWYSKVLISFLLSTEIFGGKMKVQVSLAKFDLKQVECACTSYNMLIKPWKIVGRWTASLWQRKTLSSSCHLFCLIVSFHIIFHVYSPAERQGGEKLLVRLIKLFSSTVIFSKRRKISTHIEGEPEWTLRWRILALDWKQRTKAYGTPVPKKTTTIYGVRMHVSAPGEVESLR